MKFYVTKQALILLQLKIASFSL